MRKFINNDEMRNVKFMIEVCDINTKILFTNEILPSRLKSLSICCATFAVDVGGIKSFSRKLEKFYKKIHRKFKNNFYFHKISQQNLNFKDFYLVGN